MAPVTRPMSVCQPLADGCPVSTPCFDTLREVLSTTACKAQLALQPPIALPWLNPGGPAAVWGGVASPASPSPGTPPDSRPSPPAVVARPPVPIPPQRPAGSETGWLRRRAPRHDCRCATAVRPVTRRRSARMATAVGVHGGGRVLGDNRRWCPLRGRRGRANADTTGSSVSPTGGAQDGESKTCLTKAAYLHLTVVTF